MKKNETKTEKNVIIFTRMFFFMSFYRMMMIIITKKEKFRKINARWWWWWFISKQKKNMAKNHLPYINCPIYLSIYPSIKLYSTYAVWPLSSLLLLLLFYLNLLDEFDLWPVSECVWGGIIIITTYSVHYTNQPTNQKTTDMIKYLPYFFLFCFFVPYVYFLSNLYIK